MAEEGDRIPGVFFGAPDGTILAEAVAGKELLRAGDGFGPDFPDVAAGEEGRIHPGRGIIGAGEGGPETGRKIPGKAFFARLRIADAAAEFRQPGEFFGRAVQSFQGTGGGVLRPAQGDT